jgi:hypothetical protein
MSEPPHPPKLTAPYGTWASPLTATRVTAGALRFGDLALDGEDVYWTEGRAAEGGRSVVVRRMPDGRILDVTPAGFDVRSRVHEYGGAAMAVHQGDVYFANFADQRLYLQPGGGPPGVLTPAGYFYADLRVDPSRNRLLAVREDHRQGDAEPRAAIVAVPAAGSGGDHPGVVLVTGADFYSDPVVSPDGGVLAWLEWNHPNMPWDGTTLWAAPIESDGAIGPRRQIAGGDDESVFQPEWSPDGVLHFVSDRTGWWNLYRLRGRADVATAAPPTIEPLHPMAAEFGKPQWTFSMVTYAFAGARRIAASYVQDGRWKLGFIETDPVRWEPVDSTMDVIEGLRADQRALYFIGGSPTRPLAVVRMTLAAMEPEVFRPSAEPIEPDLISMPDASCTPSITRRAMRPSRRRRARGRRCSS